MQPMMDVSMIKMEIIDIDEEDPQFQDMYPSYDTEKDSFNPIYNNFGDDKQIKNEEMKLPIVIDTRSLSKANNDDRPEAPPKPPETKFCNKLIIGTKKKTNYNAYVLLVDCRKLLLSGQCFCNVCKVLFKCKDDLMLHNYNFHTKRIVKSTARKRCRGINTHEGINKAVNVKNGIQANTNKGMNNKSASQAVPNKNMKHKIISQANLTKGMNNKTVIQANKNKMMNHKITSQVNAKKGMNNKIISQVNANKGMTNKVTSQANEGAKEGVETCDLCFMKFKNKHYLVRHIYEHAKMNLKNNSLRVGVEKKSSNLTNANRVSKDRKIVTGNITTKTIKQSSSKADSTMKKGYSCKLCKRKFNLQGLKRHGIYHVDRGHIKYRTKIYNKLFFSKEVREGTHKCKFCFKTAYGIAGIYKHLEEHNLVPLPEHVMTLRRDYVAPEKGNPMATFNESHKYKCKLCSRKYKTSKSVYKHLVTYHGGPKPWTIFCLDLDDSKWVSIIDS